MHAIDHVPCPCAVVCVQKMFHSSGFNQPLDAWDVRQVTSMVVRRRPASWSQGFCTHTAAPGEWPQVACACAGAAAQYMFNGASAFNQPVEAWDVGQVTNMKVRAPTTWELKSRVLTDRLHASQQEVAGLRNQWAFEDMTEVAIRHAPGDEGSFARCQL